LCSTVFSEEQKKNSEWWHLPGLLWLPWVNMVYFQ